MVSTKTKAAMIYFAFCLSVFMFSFLTALFKNESAYIMDVIYFLCFTYVYYKLLLENQNA